MATAPSDDLVGRDQELLRLGEFVGRLRAGAGAALIRGEPGIGKTALWRAAADSAARDGVRVLVSRCAEAEMPIPLGALSDLFDGAFDDVAGLLPEPQRRVLAAALGVELDEVARPDRLALPRSVLAAFRALAADAPLLLAVDDVQWLDPSSARVLGFAARRLGAAPIGILATLRVAPDLEEPLGLASAFDRGAFLEVELGPLELDELQRLMRRRSAPRLLPSQLAAVHAAAGGNPMFALEFARVVEREGSDPKVPLPVPSSLQALVRDRAAALPDRIRPLLELVAAVERPSSALLRDALGDAAEALVDDAVSAAAIAVGEDGVVRFTHPLLASAVYFGIPPSRRRALHREAAGFVDDLEQRAGHLALASTEPEEATAEVLENAAAAAAVRGAPDAAAGFTAEAIRLTPPDDAGARVRRTFVCAGYSMEAGDVLAARARIEPLLDPGQPAAVRAPALVIRAETEHQDRELLMACLREAVDIAPDPRVRWDALIRYAQHGGYISGDAETAAESADRARGIALDLRDDALIAAATAALAYYQRARGLPTATFGEAELRAAPRLARTAPWQMTSAVSVGCQLMWQGDLDRARSVLRQEFDELVGQGSVLKLPLVLMNTLADVEWRAGNWSAAETYVDDAQSILDDALPGGGVTLYMLRILLAGSHGSIDEARNLAAEGLTLAQLRTDRVNPIRIPWALGHVELSHGDAAAAARALDGLPEALEEFGIAEPAWHPILPDVVEALVALERLDEAQAILDRLETQARRLEHRWASCAALRCRALMLLAHGRSEDATEAAARAASGFDELGFPLDRARSLLVLGSARRRAGQRRLAAEALRPAIEILAALPAPLWLERAEEELRRAAPRPRHDDELTSAERRVAALVATGLTNREVAAQQFTTIATVEAHLTRIYRKLGVRSRAELAKAVAGGTVQLEDPGPEP